MTPALESLKDKFRSDPDAAWLVEEVERLKRTQQGFFASLALELRKPHFGEHAKSLTTALLLRAQEAGLYTPEPRS